MTKFIFNFFHRTEREGRYSRWKDAVKRTLGWESVSDEDGADPGNAI